MNLIVCDFDGVLTRLYDEDGNRDTSSYLNCDKYTYRPSPALVNRLVYLCNATNSKVLISSNWRRFADDATWTYAKQDFQNQLPKLKHMLGDLVYGELPKDRHISKSIALKMWFKQQNPKFNGNFVIFDDDDKEGFQNFPDLASNYIKTDARYGISFDNIKSAISILLK